MSRHETQAALRTLFACWGLPTEIRVDNGAPWGSRGDLPPDLALWLLGLAVGVVWNRPHHKQGNAVVERAHGVLQRWSEPETCPDPTALGQRLGALTALQRERYPIRDGQSRAALYPALAVGGRPFDPAAEAGWFDERRAWAALGQHVFARRVDRIGRISVYNRPLAVGRRWAGQEVTVRLVVREESPLWELREAGGQTVAVHPAPELGRERILALDVSHRRLPRRKAKPHAR